MTAQQKRMLGIQTNTNGLHSNCILVSSMENTFIAESNRLLRTIE